MLGLTTTISLLWTHVVELKCIYKYTHYTVLLDFSVFWLFYMSVDFSVCFWACEALDWDMHICRTRANMELASSLRFIFLLLLMHSSQTLANTEGDALYTLRSTLDDPSNALGSWDPTLVNPCTWAYVTCNAHNSVVRLDLGHKALSGPLPSKISRLKNLQYLELFKNRFNGSIPKSWGRLKSLVSLDLYLNSLSGEIPSTLGHISTLEFLRLNNNRLSGRIPASLTEISSLKVLDLSYNNLSGSVPSNGSFSNFTPKSFKGNTRLCGEVVGRPCGHPRR